MKKRTALALSLLSAASVLAVKSLKKKEGPPKTPGGPAKLREFLKLDRFRWKRAERPRIGERAPGEPLPPPQARLDEL